MRVLLPVGVDTSNQTYFKGAPFYNASASRKLAWNPEKPYLLGSLVGVLELIPVVGEWAYGIAWTVVLMLVFEEVDGIDRMLAFVICVAINISSHLLLRI